MIPKPMPKKGYFDDWVEKYDALTKPKKRDWLEDVYKGYIDFQKDYEKYNISQQKGIKKGEDLESIVMRNTSRRGRSRDEDDGRWTAGQLVCLDPLLSEPSRKVSWGDIEEGWVGIIIERCRPRWVTSELVPPSVRVLWPNGDLEDMSTDELTLCLLSGEA